ncbi:flagellar hook-length control protein FliK [Alteromonas genovensis]|uniref:Flagellar hook-length control protein FliK n=1 Tax=Alteromonas genovensis TaxID=471225 RepID=A0A6N9TDL6_9ALTE|nr:flagellar hook-length control protein FliK [Alteromonas genovensis]NDW14572.1 flagellar hook-length control protein FliK [Alteromonas genovensis]
MTSQLSNILASVLKTTAQSTGQIGAARAAGSQSTNPVSANTGQAPTQQGAMNQFRSNPLSRAVAIDNAAKVVVARLPDNVLTLSTPQLKANLRVPDTVSRQGIQQPQLVSLGSGASASEASVSGVNSSGTTDSIAKATVQAALTSVEVTSQSTSIPLDKQGQLFKAIAEALKNAEGAAVSLRAPIHSVTSKEITLGLKGGKSIHLPLAQLDAKSMASLQNLNGKDVSISLNRTQSGNIALTLHTSLNNIANELTGKGSAQQRTNLDSLSLGNISAKAQYQLIEQALRQGGVAISQERDIVSSLKQFLPDTTYSANTLKAVSLLSLNTKDAANATLNIHTTKNSLLTTFSLPASASLLSKGIMPELSTEQLRNINVKSLPTSQLTGIEITSAGKGAGSRLAPDATLLNSHSVNNTHSASIKTSPESFSGSDVHNAIRSLSRVLLNQTGSTASALTALVSIIENRPNTSALGQVQGKSLVQQDTSSALSKLIQQLKSIDVRSASPSALNKPQLETTQGLPAQKAPSTHNANAVENTANSQLTKEANATRPTLGSIAQMIKSEAKSASVELFNNLLQQLSNNTSKQQISASERNALVKEMTNALAESDVKSTDSTGKDKEVKDVNLKAGTSGSDSSLPQRIQTLLNSPALLATPSTLTSPVAVSSFVQGLVALVQLALAGRALQRQPSLKSQIDAPDSIISKTLASVGSNTQPSRVSQDVNQLDGRQQLLAQLKTLLANHQQSKVTQADTRIQGQDAFYYVLPTLSQHSTPPELLIYRENQKQHQQQENSAQRGLWNVTMKLDIGDTGQVLVKSKIDKESITLDLYASNDVILSRIADTLPYLTKRLEGLGLHVENSSFQRGHIPDTLNSRPHHIFETKV